MSLNKPFTRNINEDVLMKSKMKVKEEKEKEVIEDIFLEYLQRLGTSDVLLWRPVLPVPWSIGQLKGTSSNTS